jgi:CDP-6-deoxy-D-xylo-4-hexulose-3-dehydrase
MNKYPLATNSWDTKELEAIKSVMDKGIFSMGENVATFEQNFSQYVNRKFSVMVNSGSSANLIAIAALFYTKNPKLLFGDEVIVPSVSWSTTYFPLQQYGLKLKFVDIDLKTLNYDLIELESAITSNTRMIVAVNLLGNSNDFDVIENFIKGRDIVIIEDNCESLGAEYKGRQTGTFGLLSTFSTFFSHHMATMEGGIVTTDNEQLYHILLSLRAHGWTRELPIKNEISNKSDNWFDESYRFVLPGYNVRPLEMSGAIGIEQLKKLPKFLDQRRENAQFFKKFFENHPDYLMQKNIGNSSWFGFSLIIKESSDKKRKDIIKMLKDNNIECRPIVAGNFVKSPVIKYFSYEVHNQLNNANYLHENGFFIGNSHESLFEEITYLSKVLC